MSVGGRGEIEIGLVCENQEFQNGMNSRQHSCYIEFELCLVGWLVQAVFSYKEDFVMCVDELTNEVRAAS